jgi:hypothetical protein
MTGEGVHDDPVLADVSEIVESGMASFIANQPHSEEGLFRSRLAYDTAWAEVYKGSFENVDQDTGPQDTVISVLDRVVDASVEPSSADPILMACTGYQSRGKQNGYEILFQNEAQYFYETKFANRIAELCAEGNITGAGEHTSTQATSELLMNYLSLVVCAINFFPDDTSKTLDEYKLLFRNIVYGSGPTPDS